jgi:hypothetical protein
MTHTSTSDSAADFFRKGGLSRDLEVGLAMLLLAAMRSIFAMGIVFVIQRHEPDRHLGHKDDEDNERGGTAHESDNICTGVKG